MKKVFLSLLLLLSLGLTTFASGDLAYIVIAITGDAVVSAKYIGYQGEEKVIEGASIKEVLKNAKKYTKYNYFQIVIFSGPVVTIFNENMKIIEVVNATNCRVNEEGELQNDKKRNNFVGDFSEKSSYSGGKWVFLSNYYGLQGTFIKCP